MASIIPLLTEFEKQSISERQALPGKYLGLSDAEMDARITAARQKLGSKLVILGHHYQRDEVIKFADYIGDSFKLSRQVAARPEADYVVFCGVHFMAESADVLGAPHQQVILPDLAAGCSMADMVDAEQLETCWEELGQMWGPPSGGPLSGPAGIIPVTYINSAAAIKSFVGERGGTVCTSSNAMATLKWGFAHGDKILFMPDQHLGRNTAYKMGIPLHEMVVWNPHEIFGGLDPEDVKRAKMILWKGHCSVHERFTVAQIALTGGFDHCWVIDKGARIAGELYSPASGVRMRVRTNLPGLQVYGAYHLKTAYPGWNAICLEPENFPDAPNHANFPSSILKPGETHKSFMSFEFTT